jgi:hypothetical protein
VARAYVTWLVHLARVPPVHDRSQHLPLSKHTIAGPLNTSASPRILDLRCARFALVSYLALGAVHQLQSATALRLH